MQVMSAFSSVALIVIILLPLILIVSGIGTAIVMIFIGVKLSLLYLIPILLCVAGVACGYFMMGR